MTHSDALEFDPPVPTDPGLVALFDSTSTDRPPVLVDESMCLRSQLAPEVRRALRPSDARQEIISLLHCGPSGTAQLSLRRRSGPRADNRRT